MSTTKRTVPDVAFDADPGSGVAVYDSWDYSGSPWVQVGGTSLGAPAWAGIIALVNQGRALDGLPPLNGPTQTHPAIYALPAADFHDITRNNGYAAGPGYDLVTGLGTPIVNLLAPDLVVTPVNSMPTLSGIESVGPGLHRERPGHGHHRDDRGRRRRQHRPRQRHHPDHRATTRAARMCCRSPTRPTSRGRGTRATGTLTLAGSDTVANYQAALRAVKYQNTSDNPSDPDADGELHGQRRHRQQQHRDAQHHA